MEVVERTPISVDKMHFKNHVGDFCRKTMNPYENKCAYHLLVHLSFAVPLFVYVHSIGQCELASC